MATNGVQDVSINYDDYNIDDEPGDGSTFDASMISNSLVEGLYFTNFIRAFYI